MKAAWIWMVLLMSTISLRAADIAEIRSIMANRVARGKAAGIVTGIIDEKGRQVIATGKVSLDGAAQPDGDTVYEIGSVTKVFTSLILADMIEKGEVKPDDPVAKFLPATVNIPSRNGRQITLLDLSMQVSGLPRLPTNFKPADPANPYADYDAAKLYDFLSHYQLTRDPGEKYEYSNLAVGLLGHALALKAGIGYEELLRRRIFDPLGMTSTSITLSESQKKRLAPGYNDQLKPVKNWDLTALAGAGAIRSTANDMLKFVAANLDLTDSPLRAAMHRMRSIDRSTDMPDVKIAMAWHIFTKYDEQIYWHNGGTAGYRSFVGFNPAKKEGVVVLCNAFLDNDDLGRHILEPRYPITTYREHKETTVDPAVLERYVGEYELSPQFKITVTRDGSHLYAQATAQPRFEIFPESETEFFLKVVEAQITLEKDALILHQGGLDQKAKKVK
ncbi:MAG TPA: serine hydrolase [Bryobacteraceae bacterium]|jgi:CubicO group peptidase (beta-lactamase class C family)|nr:serine hydrolase [Bryobacteraceae bacterium]